MYIPLTVYSLMIFCHRFLESDCINFKTVAFLAVYSSNLTSLHNTDIKVQKYFKFILHNVKQRLWSNRQKFIFHVIWYANSFGTILYFSPHRQRNCSFFKQESCFVISSLILLFFFKVYFIQNKNPGTKHNIQLEEKKQSYTYCLLMCMK